MTTPHQIAADSPLWQVEGLTAVAPCGRHLTDGTAFAVAPGEILALVGPSGAGKSVMLQAALGLASPRVRIECRSRWSGDVLCDKTLIALRGRGVLYLPQQAMTAFDPLIRIGRQVEETLRENKVSFPTKRAMREAVLAAFAALSLRHPERVFESFPTNLSGGMLQRVELAIASLLKPQLIVADEPTSALDPISSREVFVELTVLRERLGTSLIIVTHDLGAALSVADRILVADQGRIVESGPRSAFLHPASTAGRRLFLASRALAAPEGEPSHRTPEASPDAEGAPFLCVKNAAKRYARAPGMLSKWFSRAAASVDAGPLRSVSFSIKKGECVGLAGLSGAGKSTLARLLLGLEAPDSGSIEIEGEPLSAWRRRRPGAMSIVMQNYAGAVNPHWTIGAVIAEGMTLAGKTPDPKAVARELERVGLPADFALRHPHELSGGELQRVSIARALAADPQFVVFDEPLSSLDVISAAEIVALLESLRTPESTWLFITHDISRMAGLADRILFLDEGRAAAVLPAAALRGRALEQRAADPSLPETVRKLLAAALARRRPFLRSAEQEARIDAA